MTLPPERWNGIWFPAVGDNEPFMESMVDSLSPFFRQRFAYPTNDYVNINETLLPLLAYQLGAVAYDPQGTESARRNALTQARRISTEIGTESAFNLLMTINQTTGTLFYVGDYDNAGQQVARDNSRPLRMRGTHSRHGASPTEEDTTRDSQGRPTATPNPNFVWDNTVYHKYVRVEMILPGGREDNQLFYDTMSAAIQRVLPFTLELVEITVLRPIDATAYIGTHVQPHMVWKDLV